MSIYSRVFSFFLMLLTSVSCNSAVNTEIETVRGARKDSLALVRQGGFCWELDERTIPDIQSVSYDAESGTLYFFNAITRKIEMFDIRSGRKETLVKPPAMPWSMNVLSRDSIYVLDLDNTRILLLDDGGTVKDTVPVNRSSTLLPGSSGQPYVTRDALYYVAAHSKREVSAYSVDPVSGEVQPLIPYPDTYRRNFYGYLLMNTPYSAFNQARGLIVTGYPVDGHIYVYDVWGKTLRCYALESRYHSRIETVPRNVLPEKEIEYFRENTTYSNILYDRYRDVYYRIVEKSIPMPGVNLSNRAKKLSVIIVGPDFGILGETDISEDMDASFRYTAFVSEEGLNLQLLTSEDELSFATYIVKPL